jgi:hypothetical protein
MQLEIDALKEAAVQVRLLRGPRRSRARIYRLIFGPRCASGPGSISPLPRPEGRRVVPQACTGRQHLSPDLPQERATRGQIANGFDELQRREAAACEEAGGRADGSLS